MRLNKRVLSCFINIILEKTTPVEETLKVRGKYTLVLIDFEFPTVIRFL